ncbi:patatin-like phospholipase family protein [Nakamurella flavida]|uniref:Patatin-like phospholipase family protein n=1 Tax=Nakamurella flavida TaxID=363630 RepID=A0A939BYV3_9ACTN|nr:patatin-like phospholipase family protein [Nakamurella flavida]MBM9475078.1 patatin-like phospholipase family protein [Nakamurella flavida]MDP9776647.1 putative patatin/cPLA2 family phospholipase [Nakamurella flavida]
MTAPAPELPGDDEVLRALLHRRDTGSRDDGHRIALVVAGGGMRGAYAAGMAHALSDAGLCDTFDVVYGSSAGAYIGAAVVLGGGEGTARVFFEDMADRDFIDARRLRDRRPVVSLDHLIDRILTHAKPMAWDRLGSTPTPLHVVATDAADLTGHVLRPGSPAEWKLAFRATSSIPFLAGRAVELHGRRWIDGSVAEPLPVLRALRDGSTHVLALVNRPAAHLRRIAAVRRAPLWAQALDRMAPGLGAMAQEGRRLRPILDVLDDARHPDRARRFLRTLAPGEDAGVQGLTIDPVRVEHAARIGHATLTRAVAQVAGVLG